MEKNAIKTDRFHPVPIRDLIQLILSELQKDRFLGIPGSLFFRPRMQDRFGSERFGRRLATPVGVAAGPHTQMALNIVAAWLCGARFIELKTIQTLDELEVSKPCIDMQDEGYNCEWSQELKVNESFTEYLNAWILIHYLHHRLGFSGPVGTLFNMSVGYNLEGIMKDNVQWFLNRMRDCSAELDTARHSLAGMIPDIRELSVPSCISDHVTLSTMHGCPPGEIEKIGLYLIKEKRLHTTVKLNPTLLGAETLRNLLNGAFGFETHVPDSAFGHDLNYADALKIIRTLQYEAGKQGLQFGVKLTNTLESVNFKDVFDPKEKMMYMSGRALHPLSITLARRLQHDFGGELDISFSAGVDCFNVAGILACGLKPATVCSDLLKPGGYGRLYQYMENIRAEFDLRKAESLDDYICKVAGSGENVARSALLNLDRYAEGIAGNTAYRKNILAEPSIKTARSLGWFDCIHAPCVDTCPTNQDIPEYMFRTAEGEQPAALEAIFRTNPFPSVTGMVCDHPCQLKCTRINYDEALQIREIKRFASPTPFPSPAREGERGGVPAGEGAGRIAIIGAGPAGLSCAWFLRQAGYHVDIFEQKKIAGGMVSAAIPSFRLTPEAVETDIRRILDSGVSLHDGHTVDRAGFETLRKDFDAIFLAAGAQRTARLDIPGIGSDGVADPLEILYEARKKKTASIGRHVVIIGGGNTAMDAARTAFRLVGEKGSVTIVYRRTKKEMPADRGEIEAVMQEGIVILELTNPQRILSADGKVTGLVCTKNRLGAKGKDGRPVPEAIAGSEFEIFCDTVIPAIGQMLDIEFLDASDLKTEPGSYKTRIPKLYIGGDALRGASTAINAIADGRRAAFEILNGSPCPEPAGYAVRDTTDIHQLLHKKSIREYARHPRETSLTERRNFNLVTEGLSADEARKEASRCLRCDELCNVCVSVCPNLANFGYTIEPVSYRLQKAVRDHDGSIVFADDQPFSVSQQFQVLNIRDLCNECGNCTTFCPSAGRPFADKPGLFLSVKSLNAEGNGFLLSRLPGRVVLIHMEQEHVRTLTLTENTFIYETDQVRAVINAGDFSLSEVKYLAPCVKEFRFEFAAEMSIILKGAMQLGTGPLVT